MRQTVVALCLALPALLASPLGGGPAPSAPSAPSAGCRGASADPALMARLTAVTTVALTKLEAAAGEDSPGRMPKAAYAGDPSWRRGAPSDWTAGFFPGALWLAYQLSGDVAWEARAREWTAPMLAQSGSPSHDIGFMLIPSVGAQWDFQADPAARTALVEGGQSLSRHYVRGARVGSTWASGRAGAVRVIVDSVMDVELMLQAGRLSRDPVLVERGRQHALTVLRTLVRPDGSTWHVVDLRRSTGGVLDHFSAQGMATGSTWARGQAWALDGLTTAYRGTGDPTLLGGARRVADWWLAHAPAGCVPFWDFDAPARRNTPRDTSAAAIAASGLLALADIEPDQARAGRYRAAGIATVAALVRRGTPWLAPSGSPSILQHEVYRNGRDVGAFIWGDYYLLEAIVRLRFGAPTMGH